MLRRMILGGLLVTLLGGAMLPAHASGALLGGAMLPTHASALVGVGQVTRVPDCPNGYKIPIEAAAAGNTWTFALAAVHIECVITWGYPVPFQGPWNPATGHDFQRTETCAQSIDPTRPGYLCLGAIPSQLILTITSLQFCVTGKCYEGSAFMERV